MPTRDQVKTELDNVEDEYLDVVYRMILSLEAPAGDDEAPASWNEFIAATYGSLADAPIERGEQGAFESRDLLR